MRLMLKVQENHTKSKKEKTKTSKQTAQRWSRPIQGKRPKQTNAKNKLKKRNPTEKMKLKLLFSVVSMPQI